MAAGAPDDAGALAPARGPGGRRQTTMSQRTKSGIVTEPPGRVGQGRSETFEEVLARRLSRRAFLGGALAAGPLLVAGPSLLGAARAAASPGRVRGRLTFQPVELSSEDRIIVPPGYAAQVLIRWGDPLHPGVPPLDVRNQTAERQARQFGYNCDFVGYFPLPHFRSRNPHRGLLAVNHEFTNPELMFPEYDSTRPTREQVDVELAAHGVSIVEVERREGREWHYRVDSRFNRRTTAETVMEITGPAAGHDWLKVSYDPTGTRVRGSLNNCAGGKTPWGTLLTCEENFNQYFANLDALDNADPRKAIHRRYGLPAGASERRWEQFHARFDLAREPNEPFRFGWIVEIDPYDPDSVPRKRTAFGRTKHEGATVVLARDRRVVVYSGDDERFDYVYKFVSTGRVNQARRKANDGLLDEGTLYVAKFNDDGTGEWLPLVFGREPLLVANGFASQAAVLINTRGAADLLGATKMDRPEDIETNPVNGKVYCVMTNNTSRTADQVNAANPRANNRHGHIIELTEDGGDPAATTFRWEIFILCGDPDNPADGASFAGFDPARVSAISAPDNVAFDRRGNLWIATDGQPGTLRRNDAIYAVPVAGEERGFVRQFLSAPVGAEVCGPEFTPDDSTLFCAIQHPGEARGSTFESPASTWPDGTTPPRPSVVAVVRTAPGPRTIGS